MLHNILTEKQVIPGIFIHHETHYISPPIQCLKTSPQCLEIKNRPEPNCPCNTRYSIYRIIVDMNLYKPFQYDDILIDLPTASKMGVLKRIYLHNRKQGGGFPPLIQELISNLYETDEEEKLYVLDFESLIFEFERPTVSMIYVTPADKMLNEEEAQYPWKCPYPMEVQMKNYRYKVLGYDFFIQLYGDYYFYGETERFKILINPEITLPHRTFELSFNMMDSDLVTFYKKEAMEAFDEEEKKKEGERKKTPTADPTKTVEDDLIMM